MLDIKFLRNNPDIVKQNIKNKFQESRILKINFRMRNFLL